MPSGQRARERVEALDTEARVAGCTPRDVYDAYFDIARIVDRTPLSVRGVLMVGAQSETIGAALARRSSDSWNVPLVSFENSAHFPYVEETDMFVREVVAFTEAN